MLLRTSNPRPTTASGLTGARWRDLVCCTDERTEEPAGFETVDYFKNERDAFQLTKASWRAPQLGALGSLLAHWILVPEEPALVSLPTGAGKTGVALAAPFLTPLAPRRVLALVPSTALRDQTVRQFQTMRLLREIHALTRWVDPPRIKVVAVEGTSTDWTELNDADVVVAIPQSISPESAADLSVPPSDMFDLVVVDEAHHLPSRTWRGVLAHLEAAYVLLLTATPFRLDRKPVPGTRTFVYPLRKAIAEGFYKPIRPLILPRPDPYGIRAKDNVIADEVARLLGTPEHATSALLVRAHDVQRAHQLAERYQHRGVDIEVLTSRLSEANQVRIIRRLNDGDLRAVAVVGMLGEGFDLPRLRLVAYHDKHKSMPATIQMIGRLARVSDEFTQESVLVTVDDADIHPELIGVVRDLYREDADWATLLPGLVDAEVLAEEAVQAFVEALEEREGDIDPADLRPMPRPTIYEIEQPTWHPFGESLELPAELHVGETLSGAVLLMSALSQDGSLAAFVTRRRGIPPWSADLTLESVEYGLSLVSYRSAPRTDLPSFLFIDAADQRIHQALVDALSVPNGYRPVSPQRLDGYLESLPRLSVSSIGMRNILAGTRGTSYKTRAGSSTDSDLLSIETTQTALGHVMMQINMDVGSTTVGAAFEKGKIWQRRYKSLVEYSDWVTEASELLWFPRSGNVSLLLPQIARGRLLEAWPEADPIAIEPNPAVAVGGFQLLEEDVPVGPLEDFELYAGVDPTGSLDLPRHSDRELPVVGILHNRQEQISRVCWSGVLAPNGRVSTQGRELTVRRGYVEFGTMSDFLEHYPPLIYFLNGQATQGHELFDVSAGTTPQYDPRGVVSYDWAGNGVDITAETRSKALEHGEGVSIHEGLERYLLAQPQTERWRWIICNDGAGEIADYLVIEYTYRRPIRLSLWHAKASAGLSPGLRVNDFQVVVAQALRSRSRYNNPSLWDQLRDRLTGREAPRAMLIPGSDSLARLLIHLGEPRQRPGGRASPRDWTVSRPLVHGEIGIAQPGLGCSQLLAAGPTAAGTTANSLHQLFSVLSDSIAVTGNRGVVLGSP